MNIKNSISSIREHFNLSQKELATKINVSKATISLWESGKKFPSRKNMERLAEVFNLSIKDFFEFSLDDKLDDQSQFKFTPSVYRIKSGIELIIKPEKLTKKELLDIEQAVKILKILF